MNSVVRAWARAAASSSWCSWIVTILPVGERGAALAERAAVAASRERLGVTGRLIVTVIPFGQVAVIAVESMVKSSIVNPPAIAGIAAGSA